MSIDRPPPRRPSGPPPLAGHRPQQPVRHGGAMRPPGRRRPPPPPKSNWLRNAVIAASVIAAVAGGGLLLLSIAFPGDVVRDRLVAEVKARTGRDLTISGPVTFSAVPSARVSLQDVTLSAPQGMDGPALASMPSLEVSVSLWPLLWRDVVVESVVLKEPTLTFAVDANGQNNWTMRKTADTRGLVRFAQAAGDTVTDTAPLAAAPEAIDEPQKRNVSLDELRIENGVVRFVDQRNGRDHEANGVNGTFAVASLTSPATGSGNFVYRGETVDYTVEVDALRPLLEKSSSRLKLKLSARPFTAVYDGTISSASGEFSGAIDLRASSLARTAVWLGATLPQSAELGAMALTAQMQSAGRVHALSGIHLDLNGTIATGQLSVDANAARPVVRGELTTADLNLNTLLAPAAAPETDADPGAPAAEPPAGDGAQTTVPGTRVNGYTARGGWNEDPIRLTALGAADADLKLSIGKLTYREIKAGASRISVAVNDSVMKAIVEDAAFYGGHLRGDVVLDGRSADAAHVGLNLALDTVAVRPLLQDAAQLDWIEGQGNAKIAVTGAGPHQRALIESLAGQADLKMIKGAVVGIDINRMAENLADGRFKGLKSQPGDKTAFSAMTATWKIAGGVARNDDLRITSDIVQVSGSGDVLLPDRSLDYTIRPRLTGQGEDDGKGLSGIEVPVRVSGSWEKPSYKADVGGAVEQLGRRLKGKDAGEIVEEFMGKDSKGESKAKKLMDKLFR